MSTTAANNTGVRYILDNLKYPDYIRNHSFFNKMNKINKIFPSIGLPNMSEDIDFNNNEESRQHAINFLYYDIAQAIYSLSGSSKISIDARNRYLKIYDVIHTTCHSMIDAENGRIALKFASDIAIVKDKPFIRKGEGVFKVYNKIAEEVKAFGVIASPLDGMANGKIFHSSNLPSDKKYKIVFSSDGEQGAWDIATISMRGITSCQSWGSSQSHGLIGSISSKYVGVVYITGGDNFNEHGTKMIRRSLVRFCFHKTTKKPALLVDRIYPGDNKTGRDAIEKFLAKHSKLPVIFATDNKEWNDYILPNDCYDQRGIKFQTHEYTYMDTKIPYNSTLKQADVANYLARTSYLDNELKQEVDRSIKQKLNEYIAYSNKGDRPWQSLFKGGLATFITTYLPQIGYSNVGMFNPGIYGYLTMPTLMGKYSFWPDPQRFDTQKEYEKAVIKSLLINFKVFKEEFKVKCETTFKKHASTNPAHIYYRKTMVVFEQLIITEYKQALLLAYKKLLN